MSGRPNAERRTERTKKLVYTAVFAAITACLAQITIPMPSGVPITLQTFAVAFAGFFLGAKCGLAAVGIYILLGAAGAPVFSGFTGGAPHLIGLTGGFVWGFLPCRLWRLRGRSRPAHRRCAASRRGCSVRSLVMPWALCNTPSSRATTGVRRRSPCPRLISRKICCPSCSLSRRRTRWQDDSIPRLTARLGAI